MKTKLLLVLLMGIFTSGIAQHYSGLKYIKLEKTEDFVKNEAKALKCANLILTGPTSEKAMSKGYCVQFIIRWMAGTEHVFTLEEDYVKLTKGNDALLAIYLAAQVKSALDHNGESNESEEISKRAKEHFLDYCAEPKNEVKYNKTVKKELKARKL